MALYDPEYFAKRQATMEGRASILFHRAKLRAKNKDLPFTLTLDWVRETIAEQEHKCSRTGLPFVYDQEQSPWRPSLDRLDQTGGYTHDNVQIVCVMYNLAKNTANDDEVIVFAEALVGNV